jgi:NADPH:quinone reductase-like Zn-dependent oxidoreductase
MKEVFQNMLPLIPGVDMAGVIEAVGDGVTDFKPGYAVYGFLGIGRGTYAQYVAADVVALSPKPESTDFIRAAALPLVSLVGWQTLFDVAGLAPDQTVLIHGASGGVGHMAVQLAKWKGAKVIGTASAGMRIRQKPRRRPGDRYHTTRFEDVVHDADVVLDTQAGTCERSYRVLKKLLRSLKLGIEDPGLAAQYGVGDRFHGHSQWQGA